MIVIGSFREYTLQDGKIVFQTHVRLNGDIIIFVHHGRSTLGGKVQGKLTSINILSLQFHTGFLEKDNNIISYPMYAFYAPYPFLHFYAPYPFLHQPTELQLCHMQMNFLNS